MIVFVHCSFVIVHYFLSIRLRLALWYSAILAVVISLFGIVVWGVLVFSLTNQMDDRLNQTAEQVVRVSSVTPISDLSILTIPQLDIFQADGLYIQVLDTSGRIRGASQNINRLEQPLDPDLIGASEKTIRSVIVNRARVRVLTAPLVSTGGKLLGYLQVGALLRDVDQATNLLVLTLVSVGVLSVVLSAISIALTTRRALRPIETITEAALQITRADDLSRRIPFKGTSNDEVGRLTSAFNNTLERLERLFNAQRRFLADISHELRTPLTAVRGNVDLLRRMKTPDKASLDAIQSEVDRMSRLVGDLLMLAQAESGNLPILKAELELDTLLLEVYRESTVLAESKVTVTLGEEDQARVIGDRDKLKQVILNLVGNAIKYTPHGGTVTLGLACLNGWARVTVSDTGVGIPAEDLPRVFDRFYRVDKSRTRTTSDVGGAGLGLSIAKWIAQAHGGRLEVSSQIGKGSCFSLWLPLKM